MGQPSDGSRSFAPTSGLKILIGDVRKDDYDDDDINKSPVNDCDFGLYLH